MALPTNIVFYADIDIKARLERWSQEDDRSVSHILRRLIQQEHLRRQAPNPEEKKSPALLHRTGASPLQGAINEV